MITPVLAAPMSTGSVSTDINTTPVVGQDTAQKKESEYYTPSEVEDGNNTTSVYATLSSTFSVIIPKTIILSGTKNADNENVGYYSVNVTGDLGGQEKIFVIPDETFTIKKDFSMEIYTN